MAAKTQVLQLEPTNEISFKGPFTEVVTSHLKLRNPTDRPIFFKVKTTAPRYYCVRPNSGTVKPGETAVISVMLQPVDQAATLESERTRHKFMIQSAFAPDNETGVDNFWKTADLAQVMDSKLKVLFVHPSGDETGARTALSPPAASPQREHRDVSSNLEYVPAHTAHSPTQASNLVREVENRKRVEDDKANLERENHELRMRLAKLESSQLQAQMPTWYFALIALAGLLIGLIFGKLF